MSGESKLKLNFNHPTKKLIIKSSGKILDIELILNGKYCVDGFVETSKNSYERRFDPTVNFSVIDSSILIIKCDVETTVNIIAESVNYIIYDRNSHIYAGDGVSTPYLVFSN
jgi:hypothetical protein